MGGGGLFTEAALDGVSTRSQRRRTNHFGFSQPPTPRDPKALYGAQQIPAMLKALRTSTTLLSSHLLASQTASSSLALGIGARVARSYATETTLPSTSSANPVTSVGKGKKGEVPEGPLRPRLGVEVNPNHGLWAFFRKKVGKDGVEIYETIEPKEKAVDYSGRPLFMTGILGPRPMYLC